MLFIVQYSYLQLEVHGVNLLKKYFVCLFIILLLFIIPIGFASDNYASLDLQDSFVDENLIISDNIYFDSSATDDGNGTLDSPYKSFSADKIVDDSVVHFANGEYNLDDIIKPGEKNLSSGYVPTEVFPYSNGSTQVSTEGFSYWKKHPIVGWREYKFKQGGKTL